MGKLTQAVMQKSNGENKNEEVESLREMLLKGDTKRLNCDVPISLYKKFQVKIINEDTSITAVINQFVYDYVNETNSKETLFD